MNRAELRAGFRAGDALAPVVPTRLGRFALMVGDEIWIKEAVGGKHIRGFPIAHMKIGMVRLRFCAPPFLSFCIFYQHLLV